MSARRAALYVRVSTAEQDPGGQLAALERYAAARGWTASPFVDHGVSGAQRQRPALERLCAAARARSIDLVVASRLDRLARSMRHLLELAAEWQALGVDLVVIDQAIDTTTPTGRLLFHVLGAIAEFERDLIRERVVAGLQHARARGRHLGRPVKHVVDPERLAALAGGKLGLRAIARTLGVPPMVARRALDRLSQNPVESTRLIS